MGLFSAESMVNLHLNEGFFLEGIFHYGRNKLFPWVKLLQPLQLWDVFSPSWPEGAVRGKEQSQPSLLRALPALHDRLGWR